LSLGGGCSLGKRIVSEAAPRIKARKENLGGARERSDLKRNSAEG